MLGFPKCRLTFRFSDQNFYAFLICPLLSLFPNHYIPLDLNSLVTYAEYKSYSFFFYKTHHLPVTSAHSPPSATCFYTFQICVFPNKGCAISGEVSGMNVEKTVVAYFGLLSRHWNLYDNGPVARIVTDRRTERLQSEHPEEIVTDRCWDIILT